MIDEAKRRRRETFERYCRERGVPFTPQRRAILDTVLELDDHPSADRVHALVARRMPGISRTTVYRTLETLVRIGLLAKASHTGAVSRYDRLVTRHHHLVCVRCEEIADLFDERLDAVPIPDTSAMGFEVSDHSVQLRGVCRRCRELEPSEEP